MRIIFQTFLAGLALCIKLDGDNTFSIVDEVGNTFSGKSNNFNLEIESKIPGQKTITLNIDPPNGTFHHTALGAYLWSDDSLAEIFYTINGSEPSINGPSINSSSPYIQLETPTSTSKNDVWLHFRAVAARYDSNLNVWYRSNEIKVMYQIESDQRPHSFAFFIPGVESKGQFLRVALELPALPRAQIITVQEYADFYTFLGIGPYVDQNRPLPLLSIDPDLTGFEGGFTASVRKNATNYYRYGYLIPFFNGKKYFGKVVRIDLHGVGKNTSTCVESVRHERYDAVSKKVIITGVIHGPACVAVLDLESLHPRAVGFRKGFTGTYPYGYLTPGQFDVAVRLDLAAFSLNSTKIIVLSEHHQELGGYSGGFTDGMWSCYCPYRTYTGPVGGLRSNLPVDANRLEPYFHGYLLCINSSAWESTGNLMTQMRTFDFASMDNGLRGFSAAVRVGRYAYFCPYANYEHEYSSKIVRLRLGPRSIGAAIDEMTAKGSSGRTLIDVLDLSFKDDRLRGFSDMFNSGKYIYLVPFRNSYEPENGQRGSGVLVRVDLNAFDLSGVVVVDLPVTLRPQIPSFAEAGLKGFSGGFASGKYGVLVPYYNGGFSGKSGRFDLYSMEDIQEVDLTQDRNQDYSDLFKGFRGGFVSDWSGLLPESADE